MNVYLELTRELNAGRLRAVICSGQAVVLHRLAVMSKDGDWILREDDEALGHVLRVLDRHGASYRYGAPLDARWLAGGWSSHFEFRHGSLRVRTDFFTQPPRIDQATLARLWREQEGRDPAFVGVRDLADMKKTNREKDWAVIGELARLMTEPADQLLYSRSPRDLQQLAARHPDLLQRLVERRPLLARVGGDLATLERELDAERRQLMHANELRLRRYLDAAAAWQALWPEVARAIESRPLADQHRVVVERALGVLPFRVDQP